MANKKLVSYIRQQLNSGFKINQVKNNLIKGGYTAAQIEEAMKGLYKPGSASGIHPEKLILYLSIFIAAVVIISLAAFFLSGSKAAERLSLDFECAQENVLQGEKISCTNTMTGSSSKKGFSFEYELISRKTNKITKLDSETKAIKIPSSAEFDLEIPAGLEAGEYILRVIASSENQKTVGTESLKIEELEFKDYAGEDTKEASPEEKEKRDTEEETPQEEPEEQQGSSPGIPIPKRNAPEENNKNNIETGKTSTTDALENIKELAKTDPEAAAANCNDFELESSRDLCHSYISNEAGDIRYCEKIVDQRTRDSCYSDIADKTNSSEICRQISKENKRDSCFMSFVIQGRTEFSVCDEVINPSLKDSCFRLKQLNDLKPENLSYTYNKNTSSYEFAEIDYVNDTGTKES